METVSRVTAGIVAERQWRSIEDAPKDTSLLLWWIPRDGNQYAEACVIGQISSYEPGKWWNGQTATHQEVDRITHWMPLPNAPEERRKPFTAVEKDENRLQPIENRPTYSPQPISSLTQEEDGWRCDACGYFHHLDTSYDKPPTACEDCMATFPATGAGTVG